MPATMQWSWALIGLAIAGAGMVGAYLPRGDRWAVFLPLVAGAGSGQSNDDWWRVFFEGSIAGFLHVVGGLTLLAFRSDRFEKRAAARPDD